MIRFLKLVKKNISVKEKMKNVKNLKDFMKTSVEIERNDDSKHIRGKTFSIQTFGCVMNFSDSEIVKTILENSKMKYIQEKEEKEKANLILINTCAIRENAENKIWTLLNHYKNLKKINLKKHQKKTFIGILGCMAERLKSKIVEENKHVDLIVGPDSYKDLPRLINYLFSSLNSDNKNYAINTQLSIDETYADIIPVRKNKIKALVSIMRGCSNMCSFCIVPYVRGVERSRPLNSLLEEIRDLKNQNIKEITLIGQNVNSYHCLESSGDFLETHQNSEGFGETYKTRNGKGLRFSGLLEILAKEAPEIRFRFTSPHPKDFPDRVLEVIKKNLNICKSLHMPVQSGNNEILHKMNRKYNIESYLKLIEKIKDKFPKCGISTDIIVGFCGETRENFLDTFNLMEKVKFDASFMYYYSEREKTLAHRKFKDDIDIETKKQRLDEIIKEFRRILEDKNKLEIGSYQLVLVERKAKKLGQFSGKSDLYKTVVIEKKPDIEGSVEDFQIGDFVEVYIKDSTSQTLIGEFIKKSSIQEFMKNSLGEPYYFK